MTPRLPLPPDLPEAFHVGSARAEGVGRGRLRGSDLARPFHGVRALAPAAVAPADPDPDPATARVARLAHAYAPLLGADRFISHGSAAALWGAPVPLHGSDLDVAVFGDGAVPRGRGVRGHRVRAGWATLRDVDGLPATSPASTWAMLGHLGVADLVAVGDYFCRVWRAGHRRPTPGRAPLTTPAQLESALDVGRRVGAARLREALAHIRVDSWSPRESLTRYLLVSAGLPEPELNVDIYASDGAFLACLDMAYPAWKFAIEYHGALHAAQFAHDVERVERLRAERWLVLQVTAELVARPGRLADRVRAALRERHAPGV
ncbi:hypothetical protein [Microbacterium excoecariae]|uniref:hypothetical protein n=1 Tax=Microbacterium excoecariae TaxID=2715210 RepID=UPI00140DC21B|nr:hypothetical protein [Microbacterium excoecariae]NHI16169.1 hypothetical protein [Microbacterium excoecariae]